MNTGTRALGNNLKLQKRLAMSILNCGRSKAWLDPDRKELIAKARTRTDLPPLKLDTRHTSSCAESISLV
jgi:ribosomal protein L19E